MEGSVIRSGKDSQISRRRQPSFRALAAYSQYPLQARELYKKTRLNATAFLFGLCPSMER